MTSSDSPSSHDDVDTEGSPLERAAGEGMLPAIEDDDNSDLADDEAVAEEAGRGDVTGGLAMH